MLIGLSSSEAAGSCVAAIIASGIIPVAIEFMDKPAIEVCRSFRQGRLSDGRRGVADRRGRRLARGDIAAARRVSRLPSGFQPKTIEPSASPEHSAKIWKGRKAAFGAIGRISDYLLHGRHDPAGEDAGGAEADLADLRGSRLKVANMFHAGDGNLHPLILYNANNEDESRRAEIAGAEILKLCVDVGGCLTGEHGVGIEKRDLMGDAVQPRRPRGADAHQKRVRPAVALERRQGFPARGGRDARKRRPHRRIGRRRRRSAL